MLATRTVSCPLRNLVPLPVFYLTDCASFCSFPSLLSLLPVVSMRGAVGPVQVYVLGRVPKVQRIISKRRPSAGPQGSERWKVRA